VVGQCVVECGLGLLCSAHGRAQGGRCRGRCRCGQAHRAHHRAHRARDRPAHGIGDPGPGHQRTDQRTGGEFDAMFVDIGFAPHPVGTPVVPPTVPNPNPGVGHRDNNGDHDNDENEHPNGDDNGGNDHVTTPTTGVPNGQHGTVSTERRRRRSPRPLPAMAPTSAVDGVVPVPRTTVVAKAVTVTAVEDRQVADPPVAEADRVATEDAANRLGDSRRRQQPLPPLGRPRIPLCAP
jgi:hypothetical protein